MDIQRIIDEVVSKLKIDPKLIAQFAKDPVKTLETVFNVDLPDDQINQVIDGIKSKVDLGNIDIGSAAGLLGKLKGFLGK